MSHLLIIKNIKIIPSDIDQFFSLTKITLEDGSITILPDELFELNVLSLNVSNNKISNIPRKISKLKNLCYLGIFGNKLKFIPIEICTLKKLLYICINGNLYPDTLNYYNTQSRLQTLHELGFIN